VLSTADWQRYRARAYPFGYSWISAPRFRGDKLRENDGGEVCGVRPRPERATFQTGPVS
jgi:hypothetical protein